MKHLFSKLLLVLLAMIIVGCQSEEPLIFSDDKLEQALQEELHKTDKELFLSDFDEITELELAGYGIVSLDGMESLDTLENISLEENEIHDFSPLLEMEMLEEVNINGNPIDDNEEQQSLIQELRELGVTVQYEKEITGSPDGPGGYLWKVENGDTTVYLQGTIHLGKEELFPLNEEIESAYRSADVIVPEIDLTRINPFEVQQITMDLGTYQDGTTIQDHIPAELYTDLKTTMEELGLPLEMVETYKPWLLSSTIQQLMVQEIGFINGVDEYFLARAVKDEKEIIPLETVEEQFIIFADTSPQYQVQMLEESLIDIDTYEEELNKLLAAYMEGDIDNMLSSLMADAEEVEASEEEQAFMEALNDNRNIGMTESIVEFLEADNGQTYFVIVGTLHYILEPHIISLLEEAGFEVEHIY
ncbi:TraB/GumN family protein [Oceanobacillus piezotolerans]|uniref:TraB/GumN family protein n=1 Tax=Oceanobacillus piezotolerans TaxID=2448030 RepID=A0A498D457_9BACI|nr:TraB/GumN family protein [Oceanobacillus piezotolerans]RLL43655.1 TraB/GumN family protein [Oceanobacillus piezotolerans]